MINPFHFVPRKCISRHSKLSSLFPSKESSLFHTLNIYITCVSRPLSTGRNNRLCLVKQSYGLLRESTQQLDTQMLLRRLKYGDRF